jgi:hypothetical protein
MLEIIIGLCGATLLKALHIIGTKIMANLINAKKEKKPTKKALMQEIAGTTDLFNVASLERTNVDNLIVILDLVNKGAK